MKTDLGCIKNYNLIQQTPMIHFQHDQSGATLRATEVKPKLDKFIINKLGGKAGVDENWFIGDTDALNYKMQISAMGEQESVEIGFKTDYDIYYGNMGNSALKKKGVKGNAKMTIVCVNNELRNFIDNHIAEFFVVTNFGAMQNKGFGSYTVENKTLKPWDVPNYLKQYYGAKKCYCFSGGNNPFAAIKTIYGMMKSGVNFYEYQRSYLFLYMHNEYEIGNEKAQLKKEKLAPSIGKNNGNIDRADVNKNNHAPYYVRALLGVCDHIEFLNEIGNRRNTTTVMIKNCDNKKIERLNSPIFFTVIDGRVYFVAERINENIYGAEFEFRTPKGSMKLAVPSKEKLGENFIDDFLEYSVKELNNKGLSKFRTTERIKIQEV